MSFNKKIKRRIDSGFRHAGLSRKASKVARQLVTGDVVGLARAAQRSHKFGKIGKTLAPSMSESNQVTKAWNSLQRSLSRSVMRSASSNEAVSTAKTYRQSLPADMLSQRLDYRYRRFGDLT